MKEAAVISSKKGVGITEENVRVINKILMKKNRRE